MKVCDIHRGKGDLEVQGASSYKVASKHKVDGKDVTIVLQAQIDKEDVCHECMVEKLKKIKLVDCFKGDRVKAR